MKESIVLNKNEINNIAEEIKCIVIGLFNKNIEEPIQKINNTSTSKLKTSADKLKTSTDNISINKLKTNNTDTGSLENSNLEKDNLSNTNNLSSTIEKLKTNKNVAKTWWNEYSKKFKSGDIVYIKRINKFGIFIKPSNKENKIRVRLIKNNNKNQAYSTDWLFNIEDIELVKRKNKLNKKFIEDENKFMLKTVYN